MSNTVNSNAQGQTLLEEAHAIVNGQRRTDYGGMLENFEVIAKGWEAVLGHPVSVNQVILCMIQVKVARAVTGGFHRDSFLDIAGYAQCAETTAAELAAREARLSE